MIQNPLKAPILSFSSRECIPSNQNEGANEFLLTFDKKVEEDGLVKGERKEMHFISSQMFFLFRINCSTQ